jgi:hypothetical protein
MTILVMPGECRASASFAPRKTWTAGTSPAMTDQGSCESINMNATRHGTVPWLIQA